MENILLYNSSQVMCYEQQRCRKNTDGTIDGTISDFIKIGWKTDIFLFLTADVDDDQIKLRGVTWR